LPDSNVNEPASHGFIKFAIKPQPNLPDPTVVQNQAAIFFDFNLPVITNRTLHTFGEQYLSVNNVTFRPDVSLSVWPNPVSTLTTFALKSATPYTGNLLVFDAQGRQIAVQPFTSNEFQWDASGLMPGLYFFRLETSDGAGIGAGSMQVIR
jgi:Secretion system C-terminal sorting domain